IEEAGDIRSFGLDSFPHGFREAAETVRLDSKGFALPLIRPHPCHAAIDEDDGGDPPGRQVHPLVVFRIDEMASLVVAHQEGVEVREETDVGSLHFRVTEGGEILPEDPRGLAFEPYRAKLVL